MFVSKFILPVAAVLGLAAAQSTCTDAKATHTISSQADATALAAECTTVSGSIAVASGVAGGLSLDGIEKIGGDLTVVGAVNLTSLTANTLASIGGDFILRSLTIMSTLAFPQLTTVDTIQWTTLNALQELTFTKGLTKANSITISDTQLNDLNGISLDTISSLNLNNNLYLKEIKLDFTEVTGLLNIDSNGSPLDVNFPNLVFAFNMTLRNISTISIPALESINSTLGFYGDLMTNIFAPNLTEVDGDLAIVANPNLVNISLPLLTKVGGGFQVANNTKLDKLNSLPLLKTTGAINFSGNFSEADLPSLNDVKGSFNMQSSGDIQCDPFKKLKDSKNIQGSFTCVAKSTNVQASGTGTGTGTSSSPTATGSGNAGVMNSVEAPLLMGILGVVGWLLQIL